MRYPLQRDRIRRDERCQWSRKVQVGNDGDNGHKRTDRWRQEDRTAVSELKLGPLHG